MAFSAALLRDALHAQLPTAVSGLVAAVSGGLDSAILLTALCRLRDAGSLGSSLRALHVDHGLQSAADEFRRTCAELCGRLDVPLTVIAVRVDTTSGLSIEAAARTARYAGFARELRADECLVTAHHARDQAETLLLQLLRGSGLKGLSAMPARRRLGRGWQVRPLIDVAHGDLLGFGDRAGVVAATDPMNSDIRFDRAFLRARVFPLLETRWPGAAASLSRTARHVADAQTLLEGAAATALQRLSDGNAVTVTGLRALPRIEQLNVLRYWLLSQGHSPPSTARLSEALRQVVAAEADHLPAVVWGEQALRRYRDRLFITRATPRTLGARREWFVTDGARVDLGPGLGKLRWSPQSGGLDAARLPPLLTVRQRRGGETLQPHARARTQTLQHLCQSLGVLPWMRDALPLVYAGDILIAVGHLWRDARWCVAPGAPGWRCDWDDAPILT